MVLVSGMTERSATGTIQFSVAANTGFSRQYLLPGLIVLILLVAFAVLGREFVRRRRRVPGQTGEPQVETE